MKYLFFLLGLFLVSCNSNSTKKEVPNLINTETNIETIDSAITIESIEVLTGFPRFFFVKDSLGFALENVKILADTYSNEKVYFNQLEKDTAYFIILDFLKEIRIAPEDDKALYEYNQVKESEIAKYYKRYGILIESSEGEYYCAPDYSYLAKLFKGDLNPELDSYKDFLVVRNRHIFDDGGVMITWMELASQIIKTEEFYSELKETKYGEQVFDEYCRVTHPLMYGTENSYIIDSSTDSLIELLPEVEEAYNMLILDPIHKSGNLFSVHLKNQKEAMFGEYAEDLPYMSDDDIREFLKD